MHRPFCGDNAVDDAFFVIDSCSLDKVKPRLYGYVVDETGIHVDSYVGELKGNGCYVRISVDNDAIRIEQDSNGAFGLYLYQQGSYFALSNSFFRLQDFLKTRVALSVNFDYIYQFLAFDLCSLAYEETAINEIKWLDRNAEVVINKIDGSINVTVHVEELESVPPDSMEGCAILDSWFNRWCRIIRDLSAKTCNISVDLSGGFDSRLSFLLVKMAGCNLNAIRVNSVVSDNRVHQADYAIARQIADYFGFLLNNQSFPNSGAFNYSMEQAIRLAFDSKMTFHQKASLITRKRADGLFLFSGVGGELIRSYWDKNDEDMVFFKKKMAYVFGNRLALKTFTAMKAVLIRSMKLICAKYGIPMCSNVVGHYLYRETRSRNHFGRMMTEGVVSGNYYVSPLMDMELHRLKRNFSGMTDRNGLLALIFLRYCPDLLEFPFEGGRTIDASTIKRARAICDVFKYEPDNIRSISHREFCMPQENARNNVNSPLSESVVDDYLKRIVSSDNTREFITQNLSAEIYEWSVSKNNEKGFLPAKPWHAIIGVLKVLDNVELSKRNNEPYKSTLDRLYDGGKCKNVEERECNDIRILSFKDNKYNWWSAANLQPGGDYEFAADEVVVEDGKTSMVEALVYESRARKFCSRQKFDLNGKRISWSFTVPDADGDYRLLLYAGVSGETGGVGVLYRNVKVTPRECASALAKL